MSKIRVLTYRLDIYNLLTKIVSFADQKKLLREVVFCLAVSMNGCSKNYQRKHCPCPKYVVMLELVQFQFTNQKNVINGHELQVIF